MYYGERGFSFSHFFLLSRSAECRSAIYRVNGRVTAQPTESGGDCFSRFLCLPLVCAVSVLHILCLVGSSCPVSGKAHIGYKVLSHHVSVWSLIPQHKGRILPRQFPALGFRFESRCVQSTTSFPGVCVSDSCCGTGWLASRRLLARFVLEPSPG